MNSETPYSENSERHGGRRWPKFYGFTFSPESLSSISSGGVIEEDHESPAQALKYDCEYLADLFDLASQESDLTAFWSHLHRSWVFYSSKPLLTLGNAPRAMCSFTLETFKKKEKFYSQILDHHQETQSLKR